MAGPVATGAELALVAGVALATGAEPAGTGALALDAAPVLPDAAGAAEPDATGAALAVGAALDAAGAADPGVLGFALANALGVGPAVDVVTGVSSQPTTPQNTDTSASASAPCGPRLMIMGASSTGSR